MDIQLVALGFAGGDADHKVQEEGGNNRGPRIRQYLDGVDPPIAQAAPWCAAFVQYCSDAAARLLGVRNPLDAVRLEAYVQNYVDTLGHQEVGPESVLAGDLVCFSFGGERWDHMGFVAQPPKADGTFWTVEGNTGTESERDGDGVAVKPRTMETGTRTPMFIRWGSPPE